MSVLESFYYMFSADTSGVDKGLNAGKKASDDMKKSLDVTDNATGKLSASFMDLAKSAAALGAGFLTWGAMKAMAERSAEATNALADNARALRVDSDELQTWQGMIERAGGSATEFQGTLRNLMQRTRDPLGALERVAERFKGLSDLQADRLGDRLGLDKGTVQAMREGSAGLQDLLTRQRALGETTKEQIDVARRFRMQQQDTNTVLEDVRRRVATAILPVMTEWLKRMETMVMWMRDKKPFTLAFFAGIAAVITAVFLPSIIRATAATWALMAPMLPMIALVTAVAGAFALLVDDVLAFRNGGNSMIGEISKNWPIVGEIVNEIADALEMLFGIAGAGWKLFTDMLFNPTEAMRNFDKTVSDVLDRMAEKFPYVASVLQGFGRMAAGAAETVSAAWSLAWSVIRPILEGVMTASKLAADVARGVVGLFGGGDAPLPQGTSKSARGALAIPSDVSTQQDREKRVQQIPVAAAAAANVNAARNQVATAAANPLTTTTSSAITNNMQKNASKQTNVTTGPITVQTQATDGQQVADALGKSLQDQIRSANDEFSDGVVA